MMTSKPIKQTKCKEHPDYQSMVELAKRIETENPGIEARACLEIVSSHSFSGTAHIGIVINRTEICFPITLIRLNYSEEQNSKYKVASSAPLTSSPRRREYRRGDIIEDILTISLLKKCEILSQEEYGNVKISKIFHNNYD